MPPKYLLAIFIVTSNPEYPTALPLKKNEPYVAIILTTVSTLT